MDSPEVMQEQNVPVQQTTEVNENNGVQQTLTPEQVQQIVIDALGESRQQEDAAMQRLSEDVGNLGDSIRSLEQTQQERENDDAVYMVRLDSSQVQTAKSCARIVCTEGLLVCILLSLLVGLQCWRVFSGGWSNG